MGFRQGAYAKIWSIKDEGNYSVAQISVSKKNKDSDGYTTEFQDGYVRLVGTAHETAKSLQVPNNGVSIQISSCDVTNKYDAEKEKTYVNYVIFGFDVSDDSGNTAKTESKNAKKTSSKKASTASKTDNTEDDDLPF